MSSNLRRRLPGARITPHPSSTRGHSDYGWLDSYHSFSFAGWHSAYDSFGSLRVLNEDRVEARSGFPTHPHSNFEIFSYILSGELTHRDSMLQRGAGSAAGREEEEEESDKFRRMRRGDVQFTTGGRGIAHSELNEHDTDTVHFLQIWVLPWKRGLNPRYHTRHFDDEAKRQGFVRVLSPLKAGADADAAQEEAAEPAVKDTIPIHADFVMGAGLMAPGSVFEWGIGGVEDGNGSKEVTRKPERKVFVHLAMTQGGRAKVRLDGRDDAVLGEGDGAFVERVSRGDRLVVESIGEAEAEVVVLDSA